MKLKVSVALNTAKVYSVYWEEKLGFGNGIFAHNEEMSNLVLKILVNIWIFYYERLSLHDLR